MIPAILTTDSREKLPYRFESNTSKWVQFEHRLSRLPEGDYASHLPGDNSPEGTCAIERKSHADLLGSLTSGRERFERELERLRPYGFAAIVVETDLPAIVKGLPHSQANPKAIVASLIAFQQRFNTHVCFCSTRQFAEAYTFRLLERWIRDRAAALRKVKVPA